MLAAEPNMCPLHDFLDFINMGFNENLFDEVHKISHNFNQMIDEIWKVRPSKSWGKCDYNSRGKREA